LEHKKDAFAEFARRNDYDHVNIAVSQVVDDVGESQQLFREIKATDSLENRVMKKLQKIEKRVDTMSDRFLGLVKTYDEKLREMSRNS